MRRLSFLQGDSGFRSYRRVTQKMRPHVKDYIQESESQGYLLMARLAADKKDRQQNATFIIVNILFHPT